MIARAFHGRLPRADWYPAHEPGLSSRLLVLSGGERARIVEGGDPDGDPVVFIHGWGCSAYFFRRLLPPVMASGRRVIALDLRGHGGSDKPRDADDYTQPAMREFAAQAFDALDLPPAHLVAHSLGGGVAIDLVSENPSRARTLTLLAPVGLASMRFIGLLRVLTPPIMAPLVPYAVPRWTIPLVLRAAYGKRGRWASRDVDQYWAPTIEPEFALALRALLHRYNFAPRTDALLAQLALPTLVILGSRDVLVRSRAAHRRAQTLPMTRSVLVPGAGHVLAEEVPDIVLREMLPHLADNS